MTQIPLPHNLIHFPDMKAEQERVADVFMTQPLQGARTVSLRYLNLPKCRVLLVLIGEVHSNPDLCQESAVDVVSFIVDTLRRMEPSVVFIETFFHLVGLNPDDMEKIVKSMKERDWPLDIISKCVGNNDQNCVYTGKSNALVFLRILTTLARQAAMNPNATEHEKSFASRLIPIDPREDFNLPDPFDLQNQSLDTHSAVIKDGLTRIGREKIRRFEWEIPDENWKKVYELHVLEPYLALLRTTTQSLHIDDYFRVFLEVPDVICMNRIMAMLSQCLQEDMVLPIMYVYCGDAHRENLLKILSILETTSIFTVDVVGDRHAPGFSSCIRSKGSHLPVPKTF